nr:hypothetical protein [Tanacetum cinerariifolium]
MNKMSGVIEDSSKRLPNYSNNQMVKDLKDDLTFVKLKLKVYDRLLFVVFVFVAFLSLQLIIKMGKGKDVVLSSDNEDINEGPSKGKVPKEGLTVASLPNLGLSLRRRPYVRSELAKVFKARPPPSLFTGYGYSSVDEYLEDTLFDSIDNKTKDNSTMDTFPSSTDEETSHSETTDKNITIGTTCKNLLFMKIPLKIIVLGLANVQTWDHTVKKFRKKKPGNCADKGKRKTKV